MLFLFTSTLLTIGAADLIKKAYFIDPSASQSQQTGTYQYPFLTLKSAFSEAQTFAKTLDKNSELDLSFYCKEGIVYSSNFHNDLTFSFDTLSIKTSSIMITTYSNSEKVFPQAKLATLRFETPSDHLTLKLPNSVLTIKGFKFQFNIQDNLQNTELILHEGENSELIIDNCKFEDSKVKSENIKDTIFRLKGSKYLIKNTVFTNLELSNSLFHFENNLDASVSLESSQLDNINVDGSAALFNLKSASLTIEDNEIEQTGGTLFHVVSSKSIVLNKNQFTNLYAGQSPPFVFKTIPSTRIQNAKFSFKNSGDALVTSKGLILLTNCKILEIADTLVQGYLGSLPAISVTVEDTFYEYVEVKIDKSNFWNNSLVVQDSHTGQGLSLIKLNLAHRPRIFLTDSSFLGNKIADNRGNKVIALSATSTMWIETHLGQLIVSKSTFQENKAERAFSNFYANLEALSISNSEFKSNTQIEDSSSSSNEFISFFWVSEQYHFTQNLFEKNYADRGGAISLLQRRNLRLMVSCIIEENKFIQNRAKVAGAIYSDTTSDLLRAIRLRKNYFDRNEADVFKELNSNPKFHIEENKLELVLETKIGRKKGTYSTNELTLKDIISGKPTAYKFRFYLAESKISDPIPEGQFITSLQIVPPLKPLKGDLALAETFVDEMTGPSINLDSLTITAPAGSINTIAVVMKNKTDISQQYMFELIVDMSSKLISCDRGYVFVKKQKYCTKCAPGTFSIVENSDRCQICPVGADCSKGGDSLVILPGYWRDIEEDEEVKVYRCFDAENCLGGQNSKCVEGYTGPLCETCDTRADTGKKYRPFLKDTCKACSQEDLWSLSKDLFAFFAPFGILLYTLSTLFKSNDRMARNQSLSIHLLSKCLHIGLLLAFTQHLFILDSLDFISLPEYLLYIVSIFANSSYPIFGYLTCLLPSDTFTSEVHFNILALYVIVPLFKTVILLFFTKTISQKGTFKRNCLLGLTLLFYLESPGFLSFFLEFFDCRQVGYLSYSKMNLSLQCDSQHYKGFQTYILTPLIILITVIIPLIITHSLTKGELMSDEVETQERQRILIFTKSTAYIEKSNRNWLLFYYLSFCRNALLLLSKDGQNDTINSIVILFYLLSLALFNKNRKISLFQATNGNILFFDSITLLVSFVAGYWAQSFIDFSIQQNVETLLWSLISFYLIKMHLANLFIKKGTVYKKIEEPADESAAVEDDDFDSKKYERSDLEMTTVKSPI